jgi:hypothetical protein
MNFDDFLFDQGGLPLPTEDQAPGFNDISSVVDSSTSSAVLPEIGEY